MDKKIEFKQRIQAVCEEFGMGIAMTPHVQKDGILITMDVVNAPTPAEEAVIKDITGENETISPSTDNNTNDSAPEAAV